MLYLCSYSLVKSRKIFFPSLQLPPQSLSWVHLSGRLSLPYSCAKFQNNQQLVQILLSEFCGTIVLRCVLF